MQTIDDSDIRPGVVCRHHSGRVYTIVGIANAKSRDSAKFPVLVCYRGANGEVWARPLEEFRQKFQMMFNGTQYAD